MKKADLERLKLYPKPAVIEEVEGGKFNIPGELSIKFESGVSPSLEKNLSEMVKRCFEEEINPVLSGINSISSAKCLLICSDSHASNPEIKKLRANLEQKQGAYVISIRKGIVRIVSNDGTGIWHGVQTLFEIFRRYAKEGFVAPMIIQDSPFVQSRGVHIYLPARKDIPFYKRFVSRFLAPLHYNTIFLEVGGGMRFERHPEINKGWEEFAKWVFEHKSRPVGPNNRFQDSAHAELAGGSFLEKDEVQDLVNWTRSYGLEVIPEIQSLTHSYYLTAGHREISELPEAIWPDSYCPSNPKSYEILFDVIEEYIEVMNPKMIHIGHDEWREPALCPKCKGKAPELFAKDVCKIHDFLETKNIQVAMWADGLLQAGDGKETYTCIDKIPSDILLLQWYWSMDRTFTDRLSSRGFQMILGNFLPSIDPEEWNSLASRKEILGAEVSSWVGTNEHYFAIDGVIWKMLLGANLLWNGRRLSVDETFSLASFYLPEIASRLEKKPLISSAGKFKSLPVDLKQYLNTPCAIDEKSRGIQWNLSLLYPKKHCWRGIDYEIVNSWANDNKIGISVSSNRLNADGSMGGMETGFDAEKYEGPRISFPEKVVLKLDRKIKGLVFFHFASRTEKCIKNSYWKTEDLSNPLEAAELIGHYQINYDSGMKEIIELRYGLNIASLDRFVGEEGHVPPFFSPPVIRIDSNKYGLDLSGNSIWGFEWRNPSPQDKIISLEVLSVETESGAFPVLLALTMLV